MNDIRDKVSNEMKAVVGEWLREDNIKIVNEKSVPVKPRETIYSKYIKRLIDILASSVAIVVTFPVNIVIGIVTFFDVGKPIFFRQNRVGKDGKIFEIIKFRNMKNTLDENGILLPANQRVTKWGKFVRKTSLDELLNFYSVLKGDMSLIGPRPLPETYLERYSDRHKGRLKVRPGLECPPRDVKHFDGSWESRFENDIWYVENLSFVTDCIMLVKLFQYAFNRKLSGNRGAAKAKSFIGYNKEGKAIDLSEVPLKYIIRVLEMNDIHVKEKVTTNEQESTYYRCEW